MTQGFLAPIAGAANKTVHRRAAVASALAGLIVAALVLMTPNLLFERLIVAAGLPDLIDAAAPPLGVKARLVFAMLAAGGVFAIAFGALAATVARRASGRSPLPSPDDEFFAYSPPAPRRRSDSHPDAPPRPPINAGDDLGIPLDLVEIAPEGPDEETPPDRVWAEDPTGEEAGFEDAPEASEEAAPVEDAFGEKDFSDAAPESDDQSAAVPPPSLDGENGFDRAARADDRAGWPAEPTQSESSETDREDDRADEAPVFETEPEADASDIMALVERLEAGLARRRNGAARAANDAETVASKVTPHPTTRAGRDRELQGALRDALDALHKLDTGS